MKSGNDIIDEIIGLLDGQLGEAVGHIGQEPYTMDFFRQFAEAYRARYFERPADPLLTADSLGDVLIARCFTGDAEDDEKRQVLMERLLSRWQAWQYAWDHHKLAFLEPRD